MLKNYATERHVGRQLEKRNQVHTNILLPKCGVDCYATISKEEIISKGETLLGEIENSS